MGEETNKDLALRAAWMSYIGGYTQTEIAERLGVSRIKAHRLIALAHDAGLIKVTIEGQPARLIELEDRLRTAFGLDSCVVVPNFEPDDAEQGNVAALGSAAAHLLHRRLENDGLEVLGVGWGRTLAETAKRVRRVSRPDLKVVSVLGSLTRKMAINPLDVAHSIAEATDAEAYFLPVPLIADSVNDRDVLLGQRSVKRIYSLAQSADLSFIGIGALDTGGSPMRTQELMADEERRALIEAGAVADMVGQFIDAKGAVVDCDVNRRTLGLQLSDLAKQEVVAVAGGHEKGKAIRAALRSGLIRTLITDEAAATAVISEVEPAAEQSSTRSWRSA